MVGVILAAGAGTRFNNTDNKRCKVTQMIGGKPLIRYAMDNFVDLEVENVYIVVGEYAEQIRTVLSDTYRGINITYVRQDRRIGLINALMCAIKKADRENDVLLQLADEILISLNLDLIRREMVNSDNAFFCGFSYEDDKKIIKNNYSIEFEGGALKHCTEKPSVVINNMKGTGFCFFKKEAIEALCDTYNEQTNAPGDLCDYMNCLLSLGINGTAVFVADREFNINTVSDLARAEEYLQSAGIIQ